jgi:hypothetical protein
MALIRWSDSPEGLIHLRDETDVAVRLRALATESATTPRIVVLEDVHGHDLYVALAGAEAIVTVYPPPGASGLRSEYFTTGSASRSGHTSFMLLGSHHTEMPCSLLIPFETALHVVCAFFRDGVRSDVVRWDENSF